MSVSSLFTGGVLEDPQSTIVVVVPDQVARAIVASEPQLTATLRSPVVQATLQGDQGILARLSSRG